MKNKLGIIGYRNHALRLINIIDNNEFSELTQVYHPSKNTDYKITTNKLKNLYECDAVIIASPSHTHFSYIVKLLENFNREF